MAYKCVEPDCGKSFAASRDLKRHRRTHTGEKPYKCAEPGCSKSFAQSGNLKRHRRTHTSEKLHKCVEPDCGKSYATSNGLNRHMRTHTGKKLQKCVEPDCGKSFAASRDLKKHERTHTGEKPYKCAEPGCSKSFAQSGNLKRHRRTHTGEKSHKCAEPGCGKSFAQFCTLKTHMITHTDEKPWKCVKPGCGESFATSGNLKTHVRTHTGEKPWKCAKPGCGKSFATSSGLKRHARTHTGDTPHKCAKPSCGKSFARSDELDEHVRTHIGKISQFSELLTGATQPIVAMTVMPSQFMASHTSGTGEGLVQELVDPDLTRHRSAGSLSLSLSHISPGSMPTPPIFSSSVADFTTQGPASGYPLDSSVGNVRKQDRLSNGSSSGTPDDTSSALYCVEDAIDKAWPSGITYNSSPSGYTPDFLAEAPESRTKPNASFQGITSNLTSLDHVPELASTSPIGRLSLESESEVQSSTVFRLRNCARQALFQITDLMQQPCIDSDAQLKDITGRRRKRNASSADNTCTTPPNAGKRARKIFPQASEPQNGLATRDANNEVLENSPREFLTANIMKRVKAFDSAAFDASIYEHGDATRSEHERYAGVRYLPTNPRIHRPHNRSPDEKKALEIKERGGRKKWFGMADKRMTWREKEDERLKQQGDPLPWSSNRLLDFGDVPPDKLPREVQENEAWMRACEWFRQERTR